MLRIPTAAFIVLFFAPIPVGWYIGVRLSQYQRDPNAVLGGFSALRPDLYTDEGQDWVRRQWLWLVLVIPWEVILFVLFGRGQ